MTQVRLQLICAERKIENEMKLKEEEKASNREEQPQ
jgi:hypothetical protein